MNDVPRGTLMYKITVRNDFVPRGTWLMVEP